MVKRSTNDASSPSLHTRSQTKKSAQHRIVVIHDAPKIHGLVSPGRTTSVDETNLEPPIFVKPKEEDETIVYSGKGEGFKDLRLHSTRINNDVNSFQVSLLYLFRGT
jgi:hypothetical protein